MKKFLSTTLTLPTRRNRLSFALMKSFKKLESKVAGHRELPKLESLMAIAKSRGFTPLESIGTSTIILRKRDDGLGENIDVEFEYRTVIFNIIYRNLTFSYQT